MSHIEKAPNPTQCKKGSSVWTTKSHPIPCVSLPLGRVCCIIQFFSNSPGLLAVLPADSPENSAHFSGNWKIFRNCLGGNYMKVVEDI